MAFHHQQIVKHISMKATTKDAHAIPNSGAPTLAFLSASWKAFLANTETAVCNTTATILKMHPTIDKIITTCKMNLEQKVKIYNKKAIPINAKAIQKKQKENLDK